MSTKIENGTNVEQKEAKTLLIEIYVKPIEYQGKKFNAYKAVRDDGKLVDCKFVTSEKNKNGVAQEHVEPAYLPTQHCYIEVDPSALDYNANSKYPTLWCHSIVSIKDISIKKAAVPFGRV